MDEALNWFVAFRDPAEIWDKHPSYLMLEIVTYMLACLTFTHAYYNGGRYLYFWFTTILHGLVVESLSYFMPDIDNFWHAQSMVMLLGKRLPLDIVFFYPVFLYTAGASVARLNLKKWAEPFAMGLAVVLLDVPFDIMGIKLLWWTWHDTDPNIYDRHYWVPWTSYYFHASFASSFCFLFHGTRRLICNSSLLKFQSDGVAKELLCSAITGLFAMPLGILQFIPIYHVLHDQYHIHTEIPVLIIMAIYVMIVWRSDRNPTDKARSSSKGKFDELSVFIILHFAFYILLVIFAKPELNQSVGLHEPTGDCNEVSDVQTASGKVLEKNTFLCTSNYSEDYYDWHCLPGGKPPKDGLNWYTICGTPYPNHIEYIVVVTAFAALGFYIYTLMLFHSGKQPPAYAVERPSQKAKTKKQKRH